MQIKYNFKVLVTIIFMTSCNTSVRNFENASLTEKDTIYILFENNFNRTNKERSLQYKDRDEKYYKINYVIPVYWKEKVTKEFAKKEYGKNYIKTNGVRDEDFFLYEGYYHHRFWFGTYKVFSEFSEFDESKIFGNSQIIKKHKSFLKKNKKQIIDYNWFLEQTPPKIWDVFNFQQKNKPIVFIIDKDEFSKDSIVLRNVIYHGETIE